MRPVGFFTWNAQSFSERWVRRGALTLSALFRPLLYASNRVFATRVLHTLLRGVSQDRLELLGEEYFHYRLKPRLNKLAVDRLKHALDTGERVVLVSQALDHVMRPLAAHLGVDRLVANRLEFRDGLATGRLLDPVIRPRGGYARLIPLREDGRLPMDKLARDLGFAARGDRLGEAVIQTERDARQKIRPLVLFETGRRIDRLSVLGSLAGKQILLIGTTGFIGKVWLAKLLSDVPDIGKVYLLIRRQRATTAQRRFEKILEESPVFDMFHNRLGGRLSDFISARVEVVEGDISQPGLGVDPEIRKRLNRQLDLVINSSGLTDFNPELREALSINVEGTLEILKFVRECDHAGLLHLSTCYVVGQRDGRIAEELQENYTPNGRADFDAQSELEHLHRLVKETEARAQTIDVTEKLKRRFLSKSGPKAPLTDEAIAAHLRKKRARWLRAQMIEAGMHRAKEFGWPNTYTFTKSLAESLLGRFGAGLPIAIVRPSIVETSTQYPFCGWNEGVNTSAPISYLLGTFFRQLPSNDRKCLDLVPVDLVCRGMTLIAAAIIGRRHDRVYHLATSAVNPCDMRRSVELTGLAHRKHYRAQSKLQPRLKARFDSITVSKQRYQNLSAPRQKAVVQAIQRISAPLRLKRPPLLQIERGLDRVEKLIELYEPFILHNEYVFEANNVEILSEALPPEEKDAFGYNPLSIDWWEYWINIHIPAQRKWSYPLIEGRAVESRPPRDVGISAPAATIETAARPGAISR